MKRILTLLAIATFASSSIFAQDDIYFTPKTKAVKDKEKAEAKAAEEKRQAEEEARALQLKKEWLRKNRQHISQREDGKLVYHVGRDISDDEYNRRGKFASTYAIVSDSVGNDIIEFTAGDGKYPDSLVAYIDTISGTLNIKKKSTDRYDDDEDYYFSRLMNRFDGFYGSRRMWLLYNDPWYSHWAYDPFFWNDPWYWNRSWIYDPWYWNDPWYYGGYYGWYSPYYRGYYGSYYGRYYGWGHSFHHYTPVTLGGTVNGRTDRTIRPTHGTHAARADYRGVSSNIASQNRAETDAFRRRAIRSQRNMADRAERATRRSDPSYSSPSNNSYSSSSTRSYSNSSSTSSSSSSSSSNRSSGSSFGGSRGGGGGRFGGRR